MDNDAVQRGPNWGPPPARATAQRPPTQTGPPPPASTRPGGSNQAGGRAAVRIPLWLMATIVGASLLLQLAVRTRLNSAGTVIAVLLIGATIVTSPARARQPAAIGPLALAVLGAMVAVLRASPWVAVPALAITAAGLILAGQGQLFRRGLAAAAGRHVEDLGRALRWLTTPILGRRLITNRAVATRSLFLAALAVVPLALLLASADAVFGQLLWSLGDDAGWQHGLLTALIVPLVAGVGYAARHPGRPTLKPQAVAGSGSMVEATAVLGSVAAVLAIWAMTQVVVAVGGAERLLATANLTAAQNARQGFFQLVAATAFLVVVIVATDRFTRRTTAADQRRFLVLTSIIAVETIGVVAATYARLSLYISGFGNTMLRASVAWFLAWLAVVMLVLVVAVNRRSVGGGPGSRGLSGGLFILAALWVVGFGLWNPEAAVARTNLDRSDTEATVDYRYLGSHLGPDAIPVLVGRLASLEPEDRAWLTETLCQQQSAATDGYGLLSWNRSNAAATASLETLDCR